MVPKLVLKNFIRVQEAIKEPITKFGGQPVWLTEPQWPMSRGWEGRPTLFDEEGAAYEAVVELSCEEDPDFIASEDYRTLPDSLKAQYVESIDGNKIGGTPCFFQGDEWGEDELFIQLHANSLPFYLNLGGSPTAFGFVSSDRKRAKLLVQDM